MGGTHLNFSIAEQIPVLPPKVLTETTITYNGKSFAVRGNAVGVAGKIAQCVGVRLPNTVRRVDDEKEVADPNP